MTRLPRLLLATAALSTLAITGCTQEQLDEYNDAGRIGNLDTGALTISFPDGYTNVAAKCVGTDLLYAAKNSNGRAISVSPGHPWCADGVLTIEEVRSEV